MRSFLARGVVVSVLAGFGFASAAHAQLQDVTTPGDPILAVDLDGTIGSSPTNEQVLNAINNIRQKYLNFGEPVGADSELNTGFIVTPTLGAGSGGTIVSGLRLFTANDQAPRDPASYRLEGSLGGTSGPWTLISSGALDLPLGRNVTNAPPDFTGTTPINPASDFFQEVLFVNAIPYTSYRLIFPTVRDAVSANSRQIADVEVLGVVVPEPSTIALACSGVLGLVITGRRRRN